MSKRADFEFTKDWGTIKKGSVLRKLDRARARSLQDVRKVGKMISPHEDKLEPKAVGRTVKAKAKPKAKPKK